MPRYEYECPVCKLTAELLQTFDGAAPSCEGEDHCSIMRRLISVPSRAQIKIGCTGAQRIG